MKKNNRAELHIHTNMSESVSIIKPSELLNTCKEHGIHTIAVTDLNSVQSFPEFMNTHHNDIKVIYGAEIRYLNPEDAEPLHMTLLAKNQKGIRSIYKIISEIHNEKGLDLVDYKTIMEHREHLLCGSAGNNGQLYKAIRLGLSDDETEKIACRYDYLEIYPAACKNAENETKKINTKIYRIGKKMNIPVIATGNCHYQEQQDAVCRKVITTVRGIQTDDTELYLHTTDEMLNEFSYLGEDAAYETVVNNTNNIVTLIDDKPLSTALSENYQSPDAFEKLSRKCYTAATEIYGEILPDTVKNRIVTELSHIKNNKYASLYMTAIELTEYINQIGYNTYSRGSTGSSFIAFLAGITGINPLPPHYYCSACHYVEFTNDRNVNSGYDLPDLQCPKCRKLMRGDGHNIPYETFMGCDGSKKPAFDICIPTVIQDKGQQFLHKSIGGNRTAYAGTVQCITDYYAENYLSLYEEYTAETKLSEAKKEYIKQKIKGVKEKDSCFPNGILIFPDESEICDFTPVKRTTDSDGRITKTTHLDYLALDKIFRINVLGYLPLDFLKLLEDFTGHSANEVKFNDPKVHEIFTASSISNIKNKQTENIRIGTLGLPEFETIFIRRMMKTAVPENFSDLVRINSLAHGTNTWTENANYLIKDGTCELSETITSRDDVMNMMLNHGISRNKAFEIMMDVCRGKAHRTFTPELVQILQKHGIPDWYIESCKKILYLFPKAHSTSYTKLSFTIAWYKLYYPVEFYAAYFSCYFDHNEIDMSILCDGTDAIDKYLQTYTKMNNDIRFNQNERLLYTAIECIERGIKFLPPEDGKSHKTHFLPENENIRLPYKKE